MKFRAELQQDVFVLSLGDDCRVSHLFVAICRLVVKLGRSWGFCTARTNQQGSNEDQQEAKT